MDITTCKVWVDPPTPAKPWGTNADGSTSAVGDLEQGSWDWYDLWYTKGDNAAIYKKWWEDTLEALAQGQDEVNYYPYDEAFCNEKGGSTS